MNIAFVAELEGALTLRHLLAAIFVMFSALPMHSQDNKAPKPPPVSQVLDKARFRTAIGESVAQSFLSNLFINSKKSKLFIQLEINKDGAPTQACVVSNKGSIPKQDVQALYWTRFLPDFANLKCPELAGNQIIIALHKKEFQTEARPVDTLNTGSFMTPAGITTLERNPLSLVYFEIPGQRWQPWGKQ